MFTNFKIDQANTFAGVAFLACQPKTAFKSTVQETTKEGVPRWEVQVVASFKTPFGTLQNEVLKIGVAAHKDPGHGLMPYTPIALGQFEVGVMEKTKKNPDTGEERVIGLQVWYRAAGLQPLTSAKAA
ncbi:hypothetical protein [Streptosporangium sp. NBC_01469]|uniref:hypothetical protein n=1 Tax=Streptosporangium sp. NBC_01469 TaxID=2903898 RepID=UPI002E28A09D|nr:hypothetical protein [Streptosporangium sp. NBC_01469]